MEDFKESAFIEYRLLPPYKYILHSDAFFQTDCFPAADIHGDLCSLLTSGRMYVKAGYPWDGASGPAIDTDSIMRPSLGHDALLRLKQEGHPVPDNWSTAATSLINRLGREDGMWRIRRWWVRLSVRKFGLARPRELNCYHEVHLAPK